MRPPLPPVDPAFDPARNQYWRYHGLDALLACKRPVTASVDEDLFITVHQVSELLFHQIILDLDRALDVAYAPPDPRDLDADEVRYFLARVIELYDVACRTLPALMSMRGFSEFRAALGPSSGFQSAQFRRLEIQSGVDRPYWRGGTRNEEGALHPAELAFDVRYGAEIEGWFARYRTRNLRHLYEGLVERAPGESRARRIAALRADPRLGPLLAELRAFDAVQLRFHRVHIGLAMQQLARVGVVIGTGGTSAKHYLGTYAREIAPLFRGLGRSTKRPSSGASR